MKYLKRATVYRGLAASALLMGLAAPAIAVAPIAAVPAIAFAQTAWDDPCKGLSGPNFAPTDAYNECVIQNGAIETPGTDCKWAVGSGVPGYAAWVRQDENGDMVDCGGPNG